MNMGVPLTLSFKDKKYDQDSKFLSGGYAIGEVLEENGYVNEFICGSDADFGGTSNFYKQHGNYKIVDYDYITELASGDKPFNVEITTIDTHTPDGYLCDLCDNKYDNQYANVIECQSKQVNDFINWCKTQSWYENTTIVITGDHNSMSEKFFTNIDKNYIRTPYNCIINSVVEAKNNKNRKFSTMDMYPTILAAMGAKIDGDRLGLGTNLFSDKQTLMEEIGFEALNKEVQKTSDFYNTTIVRMEN